MGRFEADPRNGSISHVAPLARSLLGARIGDTVRAGTAEAGITAIAQAATHEKPRNVRVSHRCAGGDPQQRAHTLPARINRSIDQGSLFDTPSELPDGMRYAPDVISPDEDEALVAEMARRPFREFEFHGFLGRRRTVSFGWRYDFNGGGLQQTGEIPDFLLPVRARAASIADLDPVALEHALLIEYAP
jgi:hypothetical protein